MVKTGRKWLVPGVADAVAIETDSLRTSDPDFFIHNVMVIAITSGREVD